jgi:hypothetical protein
MAVADDGLFADDGHRSVYTDLYPRFFSHRLAVTLFIYPSAISNVPYSAGVRRQPMR